MVFNNHDFDPVLNKFSNWCQNLQARELTQNMQTCGQGVDVFWNHNRTFNQGFGFGWGLPGSGFVTREKTRSSLREKTLDPDPVPT